MQLRGNTILITGGGTGIGLGFAQRFLARDNRVVVCGRRQDRLDEACARHPGLRAYRCDVSLADERQQLFEAMERDGYRPNVLFNHAAVMRTYDLACPETASYAEIPRVSVSLRPRLRPRRVSASRSVRRD